MYGDNPPVAEPVIFSVSPRVIIEEDILEVLFKAFTTVNVNVFSAVLLFLSLATTFRLYCSAAPGLNVTDVDEVFSVFAVQEDADAFL